MKTLGSNPRTAEVSSTVWMRMQRGYAPEVGLSWAGEKISPAQLYPARWPVLHPGACLVACVLRLWVIRETLT